MPVPRFGNKRGNCWEVGCGEGACVGLSTVGKVVQGRGVCSNGGREDIPGIDVYDFVYCRGKQRGFCFVLPVVVTPAFRLPILCFARQQRDV